jgi:hypothetical protein
MIVLGADMHKSSHTVAAIGAETGEMRGDKTVDVGTRGFDQVLQWARALGGERVWALEDCRHVSGSLERFLIARGERVARNGSKWLDFALEEAGMAAIRVKANYPAAQYQRLKPRRGHKRALGAVKHSLICAIWHMLSTGETYRDLGPDYFTNRDPERQTKRLVKQLERLGHHVTLQEAAAA